MIHAIELPAAQLVLLVDRDALVGAELRIDPVLLGPHRDAGIEHEEPEPACVEREVLHRPPVTRRHPGVVQRVRQHPLRRPLEDRELLDRVRDGRRDLEPGRRRRRRARTAWPVRSSPSGQRAEWNDGPANESMPGMSGSLGMFSEPTALMTNRASRTSVGPSGFRMPTRQALVESSHVRDVTSVLKRQCGRSSYLSSTRTK